MSAQALKLIQHCLDTKDPYLDLGKCRLTDKDVAEGTAFDTLLKKCTHLEILILSNSWIELDSEGNFVNKESKNKHGKNKFASLPPSLEKLVTLLKLVCSGEMSNEWLIHDISFLKQLINLHYLDLSYNQIREIKGLDNLIALNQLVLSSNQIQEIKGLDNLITLNQLDLWSNQIQEIKGLDKLIALNQLYLTGNQIREIKGLDKLIALNQLNLNGNQIQEITRLDKLVALQQLDLTSNLIQEIMGLDKLVDLQRLDLAFNKIQEIKGVDKLIALNHLDFNSNLIQEIKGLDKLIALNQLNLNSNQIQEIKGLDKLIALNQLNLSDNQIQEIKGLDKLIALNLLNLRGNEIKDISPLVPFLIKEKNPLKITDDLWTHVSGEINVSDNPLTTPPMVIVEKGNDAVLRYFEKIAQEGQEQVYEAKMVLTGSGESGKTSLSLRLNNKECDLPKKDERTKEVEVSDYRFPMQNGKDFTAHIWDFGGQQIIHNFHRLFMNESALYILLTETSRANDDFDYWLQTIQLFGGDSPILFVQNKRNGIPRRLNISPYKTNFKIQDDLYEVNLLTNEGLEAVEKAIQYHIQQLPIVKRTIPKSWFRLREALSKRTESYISYSEFVTICGLCNINTRIDIEDAGDFLHKLGIILWYKKNPALHEKIILEKQWGTKALFQLIFAEKINEQQKGYFTLADAQLIWDKEKEYCHHAAQLIELMLEFKIAYRQRNKTKAYIIPALLKTEPPKKEFKTPNRIIVIYEYTHLPRGMVNQLTAEMCDKIEADENAWNDGVWLKEGNTEAKISENRFDKVILIEIAGAQHRELFGAIKDTIDGIHDEYLGIRYELKIPCICNGCKNSEDKHYFNYQDIISRIEEGKKPTIECVKSTEDVVLQKLLDYLLPKQSQTKIDNVKESMEKHFDVLHKANVRTHDGIDMIKNELSQQNEMIIDLIVLSKEGKKDLTLLLEKIDEALTDEKALMALENISKEMESIAATLPKDVAAEWEKLNNKHADGVDIKKKLKLKIPIIPFLLEYETEWSIEAKKLSKKLRRYVF